MQILEGAVNPDAPQKLAEFIRQFKPSFPVGTLDNNLAMPYSQIPPTTRASVPIMFFIDRNFTVRAQFMGSDKIFNEGDMGTNIRAEIDKIVNEKPPAAGTAKAKKSK